MVQINPDVDGCWIDSRYYDVLVKQQAFRQPSFHGLVVPTLPSILSSSLHSPFFNLAYTTTPSPGQGNPRIFCNRGIFSTSQETYLYEI